MATRSGGGAAARWWDGWPAARPSIRIAIGVAVNLAGVSVPVPVHDSLALFGAATTFIIPLAVGILFEPTGGELGKAALIVGVRLTAGLLVAVGLILAFDLQGIDRTIMLLLGIAPIGFSTVTFASLERLDERSRSASLSLSLSLSLVLSMVVVAVI